MIIGFSGKKQSGKNLVAKIWQLLYVYHCHKSNMTNEGLKLSDIKFVAKFILKNTPGFTEYEWEQKSFAYKLKQIVSLLIGCTVEQLEDPEFKEKELGEEWRKWGNTINPVGWFNSEKEAIEDMQNIDTEEQKSHEKTIKQFIKSKIFTPRLLLQEIGTNYFRDIIHPNIWINSLFVDYQPIMLNSTSKEEYNGGFGKPLSYDIEKYPNWLVTDVRFKNEAKSILDRKGLLIRV